MAKWHYCFIKCKGTVSLYITNGSTKLVKNHYWKNFDPNIPTPGYKLNRNKCLHHQDFFKNTHYSLIHNKQKLQTTHKSVNSVQCSHSVVSDSPQPHGLQHARPPCPSPTPGVYSNPCPLSQWCHPTISSSVIPFSSRL